MTPRFGIDTSILVRLACGEPAAEFERAVAKLKELVEKSGTEVVASNQVIGEAYIALQHHYGVEKRDARAALAGVLQSGLVEPLHGQAAIDEVLNIKGSGLMDRMIALDYREAKFVTLTLDRKMANLPDAKLL
jgi:predicted nucleic acid-binding protein